MEEFLYLKPSPISCSSAAIQSKNGLIENGEFFWGRGWIVVQTIYIALRVKRSCWFWFKTTRRSGLGAALVSLTLTIWGGVIQLKLPSPYLICPAIVYTTIKLFYLIIHCKLDLWKGLIKIWRQTIFNYGKMINDSFIYLSTL